MTTVPAAFHRRILESLRLTSERVFTLELDGRRLWIKRPGRDKRKLGHRLQLVAAWLTGIEMLRPTVSRGGSDAAALELGRTERLRRAGLPVPTVAAVGDGYFATEHSGRTLMDLVDTRPSTEIFQLVRRAAALLASVHRRGLCLGRPSLKDISVEGPRVTFLDLEEAPETVMSLEDACIRDVWLFLTSASHLERSISGLADDAWQAYRNAAPTALSDRLTAQARRLRRFTELLSKLLGRRLGRDGVAFVHAVDVIARH